VTLLSVPIEMAGDWGRMLPGSAQQVVERMRHACLDGVRLVSDRQPMRLRVDEHSSGLPAIWRHFDRSSLAWIIVDIGERDWSKLAYQFGHELGHVLANSWQADATPGGPCQWVEEALVEAFSLRGLARLAASWRRDPPFPGDNAFGVAIAGYRQDILARCAVLAEEQGGTAKLAEWFARHRSQMEADPALNRFAKAASLSILTEYEGVPECVEALGALNRWPGRAAIPLNEYLDNWQASCRELAAKDYLPNWLRHALGVS
jgi:hypothetical protein